jgi:restriction system protein
MLTTRQPSDWRDLQNRVANILAGSGFSVQTEKVIATARGTAEIDVYGQEVIDRRTYTVLCECKHWKTRVPQSVIHSFRTVVSDAGANVGYIISTAGFQSGALEAAELTNLRLVTWYEFQEEFEPTWIKQYMIPTLDQRLTKLYDYTEPLAPGWMLDQLTEDAQLAFMQLRHEQQPFWASVFTMFSPHLSGWFKTPVLPLRSILCGGALTVPDTVLDAVGYSDLLDALLAFGQAVLGEFAAIIAAGRTPQATCVSPPADANIKKQ